MSDLTHSYHTFRSDILWIPERIRAFDYRTAGLGPTTAATEGGGATAAAAAAAAGADGKQHQQQSLKQRQTPTPTPPVVVAMHV